MAFRIAAAGGLVCLALNCALAAADPPAPTPTSTPSAIASPAPSAVATPAPPAPAAQPANAAAPANPPAPAVTPAAASSNPPAPSATPAAAPIPVEAAAPPRPKKRIAPPPPLETALSTDPTPTLRPDTFFATEKAAERYAAIVAAGGWPTVAEPLRPGAMGPAVARLRRRLAIEGDLDANATAEGPAGEVWDPDLTGAVKRFQGRMGLRETGIVAGATLKAMNVAAETRLTQLRASAQRLSAMGSFAFGDRYVVVNLPSTSVEAVENGQVVHRYVAIVGDPEHPSPEIAAHVSVINLNPTWTVPISIIKKEIIPKMQKDPGYLARQKIRILDGTGAEIDPKSINWTTERAANYILRQDSGAGNSLGSIRIGMPNKLAVYMHDTPGKRAFGADYRFLSHGCVRVQGVYDYAEWLLQGTPNPEGGVWDKVAMQAKVKEGARLDIKVEKPLGVIWLYLTGWANDDGVAHFRDDPYGLDNLSVAGAPKPETVTAASTQASPLSAPREAAQAR